MIVLILVASSLYIAYLFSYLYLWVVSPEVWAPHGSPPLPAPAWPVAAAALILIGTAATWLAGRTLPEPGARSAAMPFLNAAGAICMVAAVVVEIFAHWSTGLRPAANAYGAVVYMQSLVNGQLAFAIVILAGFSIARYLTGKLDRERRVSFDNGALLYYYTAAQILIGLILIHGFPRMVS
jgi:cytochrome c oxidase subunit I+III